jgi:hypothetical protein
VRQRFIIIIIHAFLGDFPALVDFAAAIEALPSLARLPIVTTSTIEAFESLINERIPQLLDDDALTTDIVAAHIQPPLAQTSKKASASNLFLYLAAAVACFAALSVLALKFIGDNDGLLLADQIAELRALARRRYGSLATTVTNHATKIHTMISNLIHAAKTLKKDQPPVHAPVDEYEPLIATDDLLGETSI